MPTTEVTPDLSPQAERSRYPATYNSTKNRRHWVNLTTVSDSVYAVATTLKDQMFDISAATIASGLSLVASDASSAGMRIYYYVSDATLAVTVTRAGADTINGAAANLSLAVGESGALTSMGNGDWAHVTNKAVVLDIKTKTAAFTLTSAEDVVLCDATAGIMTMTLPTAASATGKLYRLKKVDVSANAVTVAANGAELIEGSATVSLPSQWSLSTLISDGSGWILAS